MVEQSALLFRVPAFLGSVSVLTARYALKTVFLSHSGKYSVLMKAYVSKNVLSFLDILTKVLHSYMSL